MKLNAKQYHKKVQSTHDWTVTYDDVATGKQVKFSCSNAMKRSHELLMYNNAYVKNVVFKKGLQ